MSVYLDSNIFVYAFMEEGALGKRCRELLKVVREGKDEGLTSALTFNEGTHSIRKFLGFDESMTFAESLLSMPHLRIANVDNKILSHALVVIRRYKLHAADAIHIATAIEAGTDAVFSQDKDFRKVKEIKLKTL